MDAGKAHAVHTPVIPRDVVRSSAGAKHRLTASERPHQTTNASLPLFRAGIRTGRTLIRFWPGRQTATTFRWSVSASITSRPSLVHDMLVNLSETTAGMSGRWRKRRAAGSRSQTSVTCVPPSW